MLDSNYDVIAELLPEYEQTDCPIAVKYYSIFKDKNSGKFFIRLTFMNIGKVQIAAFKQRITCLDSLSELADPNNANITFTFQDLTFPAKSEFASNYISINDLTNTRKLRVLIEKVLFTDGSEWVAIDVNFNRTKSIKLPPVETQNLLKEKVGHDAIISPLQDDQFWYCVCGNRNKLLTASCMRCGRDKDAILGLDLTTVSNKKVAPTPDQMSTSSSQMESNLSAYIKDNINQTVHDSKTGSNETEFKNKKKRKKLVAIISSGVLLAVISVLVVGWFFIPFIKYEYACYVFNHYRYEEAEVLFESMGDYSKSKQNRDFAIAEQIYTNVRQGAYLEALIQLKSIDSSTASYLGTEEVTFIEAYCDTAVKNYQAAYLLFKRIPNYYSKNLGKSSVNGLEVSALGVFENELALLKTYNSNFDYVNYVIGLKRIDKLRQEIDKLPIKNFISKEGIESKFSLVKEILLQQNIPSYYFNDKYVKYAYLKTGNDFYDGDFDDVFSTGSDFGLLTDERLSKYPLYVKWYKVDIGYLETVAQNILISEHEPSNTNYSGWYFYFDGNNFLPGHYYAELFAKTPIMDTTIGYFPFEIR